MLMLKITPAVQFTRAFYFRADDVTKTISSCFQDVWIISRANKSVRIRACVPADLSWRVVQIGGVELTVGRYTPAALLLHQSRRA